MKVLEFKRPKQDNSEDFVLEQAQPSSGQTPPKEPTAEQKRSHFETRYLAEFKLIPSVLQNDGASFLLTLSMQRESFMVLLFDTVYSPEESPYEKADFKVTRLKKVRGFKVFSIDMPTKNMRVPLCKRIYIVQNKQTREFFYYTVEQSYAGDVLGSILKNGMHANYGSVKLANADERVIDLLHDPRD